MKPPFTPEPLPLEQKTPWLDLIDILGNANAAIARYDGQLEGIPNPRVLLSPMMTQEAVLSSKIEGTIATLEEVLEYEANPTTEETELRKDIHEIINYRRTMMFAEDYLRERPLCLNMLKDMHKILLEGVRGEKKGRGQFRTTQNYIAKPGVPIEEATYVPPSPLELLQHLSNWEKYCHYREKDSLVQLAIIHAQFELIHPFLDGNGRIGRILIPIFLFYKKILNTPMFYISSYFEATRDEYYTRLLAISEQADWKGWIIYFLKSIIDQSEKNSKKAKDIISLHDNVKGTIAELTRSRFAIDTMDVLFDRPIFNSSYLYSKIPKASAARILKCLEKSAIIELIKPAKGRKPSVYIFSKLLNIVES